MAVKLSSAESERYFHEALDSILSQTYTDFELIIVDDSPSEMGQNVVDVRVRDGRVRVYRGGNTGLVDALNVGCHIAKGKYVARMDADDISMPDRFQRQVAFLERHPSTKVLGTWAKLIDSEGRIGITVRNPIDHALIAWSLILGNCMTNSTVMMRRDVLEALGYYRKNVQSEDYDLWARASLVTRIENLPEPLGVYRVNPWGRTAARTTLAKVAEDFEVVYSNMTRLIPKWASARRTEGLLKLSRFATMTLEEVDETLMSLALLEQALVSTLRLTAKEAKLITRDEEQRILLLAAATARKSVGEGLRVVIQARRILPKTFRGPIPLLSRELVYNLLNHDLRWWGRLVRGSSGNVTTFSPTEVATS
jgi:glycosyltransferase involved in cell wall biosynthesis